MIIDRYTNKEEIEEVRELVRKVDPTLTLGRFYSDMEGRCTGVGLTITEKGNKKIIDSLLALGFRKVRRVKVERDMYTGFSFKVVLEKSL